MSHKNPNRLVRYLSLTLTPWAIFMSSGMALYLLNQDNLAFNPAVLTPFALLTVIGFFIGLGILLDCEKNNHYLIVPWIFYLAGPAFLLWNTVDDALSSFMSEWASFSIFLAGFTVICLWLRKFDYSRVAPYFATFAILVIVSDVFTFVIGFEPRTGESSPRVVQDHGGSQAEPDNAADLPNIYHVILDGYQSDIFELMLDETLKKDLAGFRFFADNKTVFGKTRISLTSVFNSRNWDTDVSWSEFSHAAFMSPDSLLGELKNQGYRTAAFFNKELEFEPNIFEEVRFHHEFVTERPWSDHSLIWVWAYTYWPKLISNYLLGSALTEKIRSGNLSPDGYPVLSMDVFQYFLASEGNRAGRGRYTFLHLILPHPPYLLDEKCAAGSSAGALAQYRCANMLMIRLVRELKRLDRFEDSMIIFHADHGDDFQIRGGSLHEVKNDRLSPQFHQHRSKALLLFKDFGRNGREAFIVDDTQTTLLDIAPTIVEGLGRAIPESYEGIPLYVTDREPAPRYYYHHTGWDVHRYLIGDESMTFDEILKPQISGR